MQCIFAPIAITIVLIQSNILIQFPDPPDDPIYRMNIGQVLEVHLGYAAKTLGWKVATPIFNGATEEDIQECLKMAGLAREVGRDEPLIGKQLYLADESQEGGMRALTPEEIPWNNCRSGSGYFSFRNY